MRWTSQANDKWRQIHDNLDKSHCLVRLLWERSAGPPFVSLINSGATWGSRCCNPRPNPDTVAWHEHPANSDQWVLGENRNTLSVVCSSIDYVISGKWLRWTDGRRFELPSLAWAELGRWLKAEFWSCRCLERFDLWPIAAQAHEHWVSFCTPVSEMQLCSDGIISQWDCLKKKNFHLSYFWQFVSIANVWKSQKSSRRFFFFYSDLKLKLPLSSKRKKSWKWPQEQLAAK